MILHIVIYLFIAVLLFVFNVVNSSYLPFLFDIIFVVISIVGVLTVIFQHMGVIVENDCENAVATRTEKYLVRFIIKNKSFIPLLGCKIKVKVQYKGRNINKIYKRNVCCGGRSETVCEFYIDCPSCEMVTIECMKAGITDYLGLFYFPKKINKTSTVLVMPNLPQVDLTDKMSYVLNEEEGMIYSQERPGDDATEVFAIREYVPGDKIRKIHWKLTTKSDKLMVKDFSLPIKEKDTVIIDIL